MIETDGRAERLIESLERELLDPAVRRNAERLDALLSDDFVEFGAVHSKQSTLARLPSESRTEFQPAEFRVTRLASDVLLVTYRLDVFRAGETVASSLRSSIWRLDPPGWQMTFHQGTPIVE